jgi:hypothetical protein
MVCCSNSKKNIVDPFGLADEGFENELTTYETEEGLFPADEQYYNEMNAFENKLLLKEIPLEKYVTCLFEVIGKKDLKTEQERKVPSLSKYEETYSSLIEDEALKTFATKLLEDYQNQKSFNYNLTHKTIISMGNTISNHIKRKGVDKLVLLHMMSIGFLYCKGENLRKLKFFYELFKVEKDVEPCLRCDSYSIDMFLFSVLIVATIGNFDAQKNANILKKQMEEDLQEKFCQIHAINGFEQQVFESLLGIEDVSVNEFKITWQELYERYVKKEIEYWPFSARCLRKYIRQRIDRQN